MVTMPCSQNFGRSGIVFRWATTYLHSAPSCPIRCLPRLKYIRWAFGSNHHPSLGSPCWIVGFYYLCPNSGGKLCLFQPGYQFIYDCLVGLDS